MANYRVTIDKNLAQLYHYGIPGQKKGKRRFQNLDGSLTEEGRERYGVGKKSKSTKDVEDPYERLDRAKRMQDSVMREIDKRTGPDGKVKLRPHEDRAIRREFDEAVKEEAAAREQIKKTESSIKKIDEAMGNTPEAAKAYQENLRKSKENEKSENEKSENGLVPYGEKGIVPKKDADPDNEDKTTSKTESFKPGDDGYEIHKAPKNDLDSDTDSKSKPKDIHDVEFEDKTDSTKSGKSKTEKEAEEAHKRAEERAKEAEKNKKEEEAEKKKNEQEREKAKKEKEAEEKKKADEAEKREKEAEKNKKEEEAKKKEHENESDDKKIDVDKLLKSGEDIAGDASKISNEIANIASRKSVNVPRLKLDQMTNEQLQKSIQREILEKQYDSMFNSERHRVEARKEKTVNFFKNVGSAITITGSALAIAATVKGLLNK